MVHNDNNPHTICVDIDGMIDHFSHGDWMGEFVTCDQGIVIQNPDLKNYDEKASEGLSIYPNPSSSIINLKIDTDIEEAEINIYDISGTLKKKGRG